MKSWYQVMTTLSSPEALGILDKRCFDSIFLDLFIPELDGVKLFRRRKQKDKHAPVATITGYPDSDLMRRAMAHGPFVVMKKQFNSDDILNTIVSFVHESAK